jgi:ribosomal protein S18 acetylase RimI-like enzyme
MTDSIVIEKAQKSDCPFIFELSPRLAEVAKLAWHTEDCIQKMQDNYITEMLNKTSDFQVLLIAKKNDIPLGFIHACEHKDGISGEACGTVTLLAVSPSAQGLGVGKLLMMAAENWAIVQGYRLLHLEVFATNNKAQGFYRSIGFEPEILHMIKSLEM